MTKNSKKKHELTSFQNITVGLGIGESRGTLYLCSRVPVTNIFSSSFDCGLFTNVPRTTVHSVGQLLLAPTLLPDKLVSLWSSGGLNADTGECQLEEVGGTGGAQLREGQVVHTKVLHIIIIN